MRTTNSIKNSITSTTCYIISILIGFLNQSLFIKVLGVKYLGLNGLFSNILGMLGIFELGIGSAIIYNLYKPIAENKEAEIKSLMLFYKKAYNIIAILITVTGLAIMPFLKSIVGEITVDINIYIIYILFLFQTVSSYIITYKRSLIYANQKNYIINIIHLGYLIIFNISKLVILFITKNYYLYLGVMIIGQFLENIVISVIANKMYPYLLDKNVEKLSKDTEKNIFKKVKALIFHKIGTIIVLGTDNIIISRFFGVITVGLYSSYCMIISPVSNLFGQMISSATASVGNLLATEEKEKVYKTFKKIRFLNFWLSCFSGVCLLVIMQSFITVWIGEDYLLPMIVLVTIIFNYYQKMMRNTYMAFKDSAGIWEEDKFIPLIESVLNIVSSVICLKIFGLAGVFMGTIISGLALWCYSYPKFVYKKLFNRSYIDYAKETIGYMLLFVFTALITYGISILVNVSNPILQIIVNCIICIIVPNLILFIIFRKSENFQYFIELLSKMLRKIKLKKENKVKV